MLAASALRRFASQLAAGVNAVADRRVISNSGMSVVIGPQPKIAPKKHCVRMKMVAIEPA